MSEIAFNRRTLLRGAGGAAILLGSGALAGCGSGGGNNVNSVQTNSKIVLPTYIPYTGLTPDFPATEAGIDPTFRNYPKQLSRSVTEIPAKGESLVGLSNIYLPAPPTPDGNSWWAGLNKRLGANLSMQMVPAADYAQKFATTIAGNDLPDMIQMPQAPNMPDLLAKRFARLDDHLSGDAIKDYPNLANIQSAQWKQTVFNGGIYGIPIPRSRVLFYSFIRQDLFEKAGVSSEPKGREELLESAKALTNAKERRWAFGSWEHLRLYLLTQNEAPNGWDEEGGKLTHVYETEQYKQTINDIAEFWKAGVIHPDSFSATLQPKALFNAGTIAINAVDGMTAWSQYITDNSSNPDFKLGVMPIYTRDGRSLAPWQLGSGLYSFTGLKKQDDPNKIKTILRVLNWLAAPFGTEEYTYAKFGQEGVDHTISANGSLSLTKQGITNTALPIRYLADAPITVYQPGRPDDADIQYTYQKKIMAKTISNPTVGLYSNTAATKNAGADKTMVDGVKEVIQGRKPMSSLDELIKKWRTDAGDAMRGEYEEQLQTAGTK
ncbi:extracellular solute-binding protein [Arthrobacter bambusae]|uniref:extracellular solute-binding protein n=1 Tax=Arthrobacter bambusae TaxID=1338426 RepID=UPI00277D1F5F|nr:extracellular solute-binding protein [Arthrobacter bambusae]MDQ0127398.1 putative aldouronate transport system substrate-binding protein [Arthrobacter bambusae]